MDIFLSKFKNNLELHPQFNSKGGSASSSALPKREEIDDKYKWRLEDIYHSDEEWRKDFENSKATLPKILDFKGILADSGETLFKCLDFRDNLSIILNKLTIYAYLRLDENNKNNAYQAMTDEISVLGSKFGEYGAFMTPELLKISDERMQQLVSEYEALSLYDHHLENIRRQRDHILTQDEEMLLALSGNMSRGPSNIFRMIDNADIKFGKVKNEDGEEIELSKQRYYDLLESKNRTVRQEAMECFNGAYVKFINTLGATLSASVYKDYFYTKARKYDSCLQASLQVDNIPEITYQNLTNTVNEHISALHKFAELRKKVMKLDILEMYDVYVPLVPDAKIKINYDDAIQTILKALAPLGSDYIENLISAFNSGWIDVYESEGKGSGAYSWSTYATHPYVLMNYNDTLDNMFTLAHEMGHAMHSRYSKLEQPFIYSGHSIFTAEVTSTTNELLLMDYMLKNSESENQKAYLLNYHIQQIVGTFYTQVLYSEFEAQIHQAVEEGKPLSTEILRKLFRDIFQRFWGDALHIGENNDIGCLRIPHFYRSFYVYQYATSYAASTMISQKIISGDQEQVDNYLKFLKAGESDYPIEVLKIAGIDLTKPEPIVATVNLFAQLVDQLEKLLLNE